MLTEEAMFQRQWGDFPALAAVVGKKTSTRWTGLTSVSPGTLDRLDNLLHIFALVMDSKAEVSQMAQSETGDPLREELWRLSAALGRESEFIAHLSREIQRIPEQR